MTLIEGIRTWAAHIAGPNMVKAIDAAVEARLQAARVNNAVDVYGWNESLSGVAEPYANTFERMRELRYKVGPVKAIITTRKQQVERFADTPMYRQGQAQTPGFEVVLTDSEEEPTAKDKKVCRELEGYIRETGYCAPPEDETPDSYQPGFVNFLGQMVEDTLTIDQFAVRTWASKRNADKYPVVSFAPVDGGLVRRTRGLVEVVNGVPRREKYEAERTNTSKPVRFIMYDRWGSTKRDEFTTDEMRVGVRNMRTDERANGYGYSEVEQSKEEVEAWLSGFEMNTSRFTKDSLPRGVFFLSGDVAPGMMAKFQLMWKQICQGSGNRWQVPMLAAKAGQGNSMNWMPVDMSSRDMEYHQFMFAVSVIVGAVFGVNLEECGLESLNPVRPPLSQGSPEAKIKYSQDRGLGSLLRWSSSFLNRNMIWRMHPDRRYSLRYAGLGDYDPATDVALWGQMLQMGLGTPRMWYAATDTEIPDLIESSPALDFPAPFAQGIQLMQQLESAEAQQAQSAEQSAYSRSADDERAQWQRQGAAGGFGGQGGQGGPNGGDFGSQVGNQGQDGVGDDPAERDPRMGRAQRREELAKALHAQDIGKLRVMIRLAPGSERVGRNGHESRVLVGRS